MFECVSYLRLRLRGYKLSFPDIHIAGYIHIQMGYLLCRM